MDARGRLPRTAAPYIGSTFDALADGMIEYNDAIRFQRRPEEGLGGGVIDAPHFLVVVEIPNARRVADQGKTLAVERDTVRDQAGVKDRDLMRFGQRGRFGFARRRIKGIGTRLSGRRGEIIKFTGNKGERLEFGLLQAHGDLLDSLVGSTPFWLAHPPRQGRAANSKFVVLAGAKQGKSLSRTRSRRDGYSALHGFVRQLYDGRGMPGKNFSQR